jgi:hypothetical protein
VLNPSHLRCSCQEYIHELKCWPNFVLFSSVKNLQNNEWFIFEKELGSDWKIQNCGDLMLEFVAGLNLHNVYYHFTCVFIMSCALLWIMFTVHHSTLNVEM